MAEYPQPDKDILEAFFQILSVFANCAANITKHLPHHLP